MQGAVNVPIIKDVLAIRLAANIENTENNRIYSINTAVKPELNDQSYRATVLFKPVDSLSVQAMYQRRTTLKIRFDSGCRHRQPGRTLRAIQGFWPRLARLV